MLHIVLHTCKQKDTRVSKCLRHDRSLVYFGFLHEPGLGIRNSHHESLFGCDLTGVVLLLLIALIVPS